MKKIEQLILALLAKAFPSLQPKVDQRKSVDSVLGSLNKAIAELGSVQSAQQAEADRQAAAAVEANQRSAEAREEAKRAAAVRARMESLVGA